MVTEQLPVVVDLARRVALVDRLVLVFAGLLVLRVGAPATSRPGLPALVLPSVVAVTGGPLLCSWVVVAP